MVSNDMFDWFLLTGQRVNGDAINATAVQRQTPYGDASQKTALYDADRTVSDLQI